MMSFFSNKPRSKAKVVQWNTSPCLIAHFQTSNPPLVWQLDLEKITSYSLMVSEKEGGWDLGYTVPQGQTTVVAHFDEREDADQAYQAVQKALLKGGSCATSAPARRMGWFGKLVLVVLVLFVLGVVVLGATRSTEHSDVPPMAGLSRGRIQGMPMAPEESTAREPEELRVGVPMAADDVLPKN